MCTAEQQAVNIDTQDKQVDFTRWSTNQQQHNNNTLPVPFTLGRKSRYHAHTEEQAVTIHTLENKQLPCTHRGTNSYHPLSEEQPVT